MKKTHTFAFPMSVKEELDKVKQELQEANQLHPVRVSNVDVVEFLLKFYQEHKNG